MGGDEALHLAQFIRCHLRWRQGLQNGVLKVFVKHGMSLGNLGHYLGDNLLRRGVRVHVVRVRSIPVFIRRLGRRLQCRHLRHFRFNQLIRILPRQLVVGIVKALNRRELLCS